MGDALVDDERAKRREERRRRRAEEKQQEEQNWASSQEDVVVTSFHGSKNKGPEIEVKLKKTPRVTRDQSEDKPGITEAERKAEEIRLKREREQDERFRELREERKNKQLDEMELQQLGERRERRRLKQEAEERRLKQEQEERAAKEAEDARKLREDIQKRRLEAEERRRNIQNSLTYVSPKYSMSESIFQADEERVMSPEERAVHKRETMEERCPPLDISTSMGVDRIKELALNLQAKLVELYEAKFDLLKRKERQEYDLNELKSRMEDLTKVAAPKKPIGVTVHSGHVNKIKEKGFFVEEKPVRKSFLQERNEGIAASGGVQGRLGMFQTKIVKGEDDQTDVRKTPGKSAWKAPEYEKCVVCNKNVYTQERLEVAKKVYHRQCFKCEYCKKVTSLANYAPFEGKIYCKTHQRKVERESMQQGITARP